MHLSLRNIATTLFLRGIIRLKCTPSLPIHQFRKHQQPQYMNNTSAIGRFNIKNQFGSRSIYLSRNWLYSQKNMGLFFNKMRLVIFFLVAHFWYSIEDFYNSLNLLQIMFLRLNSQEALLWFKSREEASVLSVPVWQRFGGL